jgi:hypothetical protein
MSRFAVSTQRAGFGRSADGGATVLIASSPSADGSGAPAIGRRVLLRLALAAALLTVGFLLVASSPARAAEHVTVTGEYGKEGPKAGGIGNGCNIAWQGASNRLYLLADNKIYGLNKTAPGSVTPVGGSFPLNTQNSSCGDRELAVDNSGAGSNGNIYMVPSNNNIYGYNSSGAELGGNWPVNVEGETCGVAIDNVGNVWGGKYSSPTSAKRYSPAGIFQLAVPLGFSICKLQVNPANNDLYVVEYSGNGVKKYTAASGYTTMTEFPATGSGNPGITINGVENRLYIASGNTVKAYDTNSAALLETIEVGGSAMDVTVDESTDTLFVSVDPPEEGSSNTVIKEYLGVKVPKATTGEPTGNTEVSGTADPNEVGPITDCYFEYGLTAGYGKEVDCTEAVPFNEVKTVHAVLPPGELVGEETYHYRLVLDTGKPNVIGRGGDKTIIPHYVKSVKTEDASEVTRQTAKLNGSFEGNGEVTSYFFEYGTSACPCATRMPVSPTEVAAGSPPGPGTTPMSVSIAGLTPDTTYYFRVVAKNPQGTSPGKDKTFTTPLAVQGVTTEDATEQTRDTAKLNASFTGNGEAHTYKFQWGPTTSYGNEVAGSAGSGTGTVPVSSEIEGLDVYLPSSQPYHYRVLVTNATGTTAGPDHTFHPAPPGLPQVSGLAAENVSPTEATLTGLVNPEEGPTTYIFEYGPTDAYGSFTPNSTSVGDDTSNHAVDDTITGLIPGTVYHFRLVASNFGGTTHSADQTFITPGIARIESATVSAVTQTTAQLSSLVVPNGSPTSVSFEYGPTDGYGQSTASQAIGQDLFLHDTSAALSGLSPSTTYHFRVVAANGVGTARGIDQTFTTAAAPAVVAPPETTKTCKKPKVLRKGKCVKRPKKKKTRRGSQSNG